MGAVHVGVGHNDYPPIAQSLDIEIVAYARPQSSHQRPNFIVIQNLIQPGPFSVKDFTS